MDQNDLKPQDAQLIHDKLRSALQYLARLKKRMIDQKFPENDRLYEDVVRAHEAMARLGVSLHYLSCKGGVGRKKE